MKAQPLHRNLILLTNHFPFGVAEAFLENEIPYLTAAFDKVVIITKDVTSNARRKSDLPYVFYRLSATSGLSEKIQAPLLLASQPRHVAAFVRSEIQILRRRNKLSAGVLQTMLHDLMKALTISKHIERVIREQRLTGEVVIYSYWLNSAALASLFVNVADVKVRRISRAHGGDVYEDRNPLEYLSFRHALLTGLDRTFAISKHARNHLLTYLDNDGGKINVSRLGTHKPTVDAVVRRKNNAFVIVSCSFMVPVKRIHLIIEALGKCREGKIRWVHIGDGPLRSELDRKASAELEASENVTYSFEGNLSNDALLAFYASNQVDLFINTSSSEGVPVTMMEAQSFGIPILAPRVGGVPEIVVAGTGMLFEASAEAGQIAGLIDSIIKMEPGELDRMRANATANWDLNYNAAKNFPTFVRDIQNL